MPWTEERRAKQMATVAAKKGATVADAPEITSEYEPELMAPDGSPADTQGAEVVSSMESFMARMRGQAAVHTTEDATALVGDADVLSANNAGDGAVVDHQSGGLVWLYAKESWGWHRRRFPRNSLMELVRAGHRDSCGTCGSNQCPGEINGCPQGKMYQYLACPIAACNGGNPKRFYDIEDTTTAVPSDDPFAIRENVYADVTPVTRIRAQLDAHLRAYHEQTAVSMGLMQQRVN